MNDQPDPLTDDDLKGMADPLYRKERRRRLHPFNFELNDEAKAKLKAVAHHRCISMGATLRQLITTAYLMDLKGLPSCATGRACFMPHLHPQEPAAQDLQGRTL